MKHSRFTALILVAILLAFLVQGSALAGPKQDKGWLGVSIASISDDLASDHNLSVEKGVYVVDVFEKSPAMQAGVKPGDVIVALEGDKVATTEDLTGALSAYGPGEKVMLTLVRGDKKLKLTVKLGERQAMPSMEKMEFAEKMAKKEYAVKLKEHEKALKEHEIQLKKHEKMAKEHQIKAEELIKQAMKEHKHELSEEEMAKLERALKELDSQLYKLDEHIYKFESLPEMKIMAREGIEPFTLMEIGGGAFLGVYPVTVTDNLVDKVNLTVDKGVYITGVVDDGPAEKAGIVDGDVVVVIDGEKVADEEGLRKVLAQKEAGDQVVVVLVRGDDKKKVKVELGGGDKSMAKAFAYAAPSDEHIKFFEGDFAMPQMEQKGMLGVLISDNEDGEGVLVTGFTDDSAAEEAGMLEGDIIINVNGHSTPDMKSLLKVMEDKKPGEEVKVKYQRDGKARALKFELGKSAGFFDAPMMMNIHKGDEDAHKLFLKGLSEHEDGSPFIWHAIGDDDKHAPVMWSVSEDGDHVSMSQTCVKVLCDDDDGEMKITIIGDDGEYKVLKLDELEKEGFKVKVDEDSDGQMIKKYVKMRKDGTDEQTVEICIVCPDGKDVKVITIDDDEDPDNYPKAKKKYSGAKAWTSSSKSSKSSASAKSSAKSSSKSGGKSYAKGGGGGGGWSSGGGSGGGDSTGKTWKTTWSDGSGGTKDGPWMGIMVDENSMDLAENKGLTLNYGIYVAEVEQGSPADKAGLRAGDVIIQAGDSETAGMKQFIETTRTVKAGDELYLKVVRGKNRVKLNIKRPG